MLQYDCKWALHSWVLKLVYTFCLLFINTLLNWYTQELGILFCIYKWSYFCPSEHAIYIPQYIMIIIIIICQKKKSFIPCVCKHTWQQSSFWFWFILLESFLTVNWWISISYSHCWEMFTNIQKMQESLSRNPLTTITTIRKHSVGLYKKVHLYDLLYFLLSVKHGNKSLSYLVPLDFPIWIFLLSF